MKISEHFTLEEFILSDTAIRHGYENKPNQQQIANMVALCVNVLEPLRYALGQVKGKQIPIIINSGFRDKRVNALVGGKWNSQHTEGKAADLRALGIPVHEFYALTKQIIEKNKFEVDQLIFEFDSWIHVSYNVGNPQRGDFLIASKNPAGKTIYTKDEKKIMQA